MKHHSEFPLSILQEVRREDDWKVAMMKKMRNLVERMLKFYMRGLGKLQESMLEILGFFFTPDEKKYIYRKPGTSGFSRTFSEEHGLEKIVQFLKDKRLEYRSDSENSGLVLTTQTIENLQ